jgi:PhoPQ-activated pathogenicity-related protein
MTSQVWRSKGEVDIPAWTHWVNVWIPDTIVSAHPIFVIGGGHRRSEVPSGPPSELSMFRDARAMVVAVDNVPNQPLKMGDDPAERNEDGIVARTWVRAMDTGDPTWIARFPMVKSAVRAMDAFEAFLHEHPPTHVTLDGRPLTADFKVGTYLVAGGSKRGWTTWLTAAVEPRVGALVPLVIDILDLTPQMHHHHDAYGFWAPALGDYAETGFTGRWADNHDEPVLASLLAHDDPINWLSRVGTKPKLLINATGDEFFLPDSAQFYVNKLPQPWRLRYEPNSGHNLKQTPAPQDLIAFYLTWATDSTMPGLTWEAVPSADKSSLNLTAHLTTKAARVQFWSARSKGPRDFRIDQIGKAWTSNDLAASDPAGLTFTANITAPSGCFSANFIEVDFPPLKEGWPGPTFTTQVYVLPDVLPHAGKH